MQFHLLSIGCHVYSYSTVNRRTFDLLHKLQLLPAMDCSGTPHVVDHCSPRWSAVVPLYFHCTLTANISSVGFLDWYGQFLPDHTGVKYKIMDFMSSMDDKKYLPYNKELLKEALHMCKRIRDRNLLYHESLFEKARDHFKNYPDSRPEPSRPISRKRKFSSIS